MFKFKNSRGLTLIELLVVIAIIGTLATLGIVSLIQARKSAKISKAQEDVRSIYNAIALLQDDTSEWPGHKTPDQNECDGGTNNEICNDGCTFSLSDCESGLSCDDGYDGWRGPYMANIPEDPWGNQYFFDTDYTLDGECVVVVGSYGPDGRGNNLYNADDIVFVVPSNESN